MAVSSNKIIFGTAMGSFQEPIYSRYLPYIRPIFEAYVRECPHKIWPKIWYSTSILVSWNCHWDSHGQPFSIFIWNFCGVQNLLYVLHSSCNMPNWIKGLFYVILLWHINRWRCLEFWIVQINWGLWPKTTVHTYHSRVHVPFIIHVYFIFSGLTHFSPPARWGLLDFMSVASCVLPSSACRLPPPPPSPLLLVLLVQLRPAIHSVPCRTSTTTIHAQCSLPDLNHDHPRPGFPAGPQPRVSPPSVPCRTSTTTIHAQCSLPDLNREYPCQVFPAGPHVGRYGTKNVQKKVRKNVRKNVRRYARRYAR